MKRQILTQFLNNISEFPNWIKAAIYNKLSEEKTVKENLLYIFSSYKPILTYSGKCELDYKNLHLDSNIYNLLESANKNYSISEITLNNYFTLEETASYFVLCIDEGFFEHPDEIKILNIANFLAGKYRTGEYFLKNGKITENQLAIAYKNYEQQPNHEKKFGQILTDNGFITITELQDLIFAKNEATKRFVLDYNDMPKFKREYTDNAEKYQEQIVNLQNENKILKSKLEQLLTMVKNND